MRVPFSTLKYTPFEVAVTSAGVAIPVTTWPEAGVLNGSVGGTAILTVEVPDGFAVIICGEGLTFEDGLEIELQPNDAMFMGRRSDADNIRFSMRTTPIRQIDVADLRLYSTANVTVVCRWVPYQVAF